MKELTIEDILAADDVRVEQVPVPEWGGAVYLRTISADRRDAFDLSCQDANFVGMRARLVAACLCTKDGRHVQLTDHQRAALGNRMSGPVDRLFDVCQRINGMLKTDLEKLEGNSGAADGNGSG